MARKWVQPTLVSSGINTMDKQSGTKWKNGIAIVYKHIMYRIRLHEERITWGKTSACYEGKASFSKPIEWPYDVRVFFKSDSIRE